MLSVSKAAHHFGVHPQTIRQWTKHGRIGCLWTPTGQRRVAVGSTENSETAADGQRFAAVYYRVSSAKQKDDLDRQIDCMRQKYPDHKVFKDVASGINFKRKGLLALLDASMQGLVSEVVVSSRDRLCRFAFELLQHIFEKHGTKLTVLEQGDESPESEMSNDVLSIIQVFCCRRNGKRRYRSACSEGEAQTDDSTKGDVQEVGGGVQIHVQHGSEPHECAPQDEQVQPQVVGGHKETEPKGTPEGGGEECRKTGRC
jgi:predicted site-specific integrase-resolvase